MDYKGPERVSKLALWARTGLGVSLSFIEPRPYPEQSNHRVIIWRKEHSDVLGPYPPPFPTLGQILRVSGQPQQVREAEKIQETKCEPQGVDAVEHTCSLTRG